MLLGRTEYNGRNDFSKNAAIGTGSISQEQVSTV